jgi:hypothetical protein
MTAEEILKIDEPGLLFSDPDQIHEEYKTLAKYWHPDISTGSKDVMARINILYQRGMEQIEQGRWHVPFFLRLKGTDGKYRQIKYRVEKSFELGKYYISDTVVVYLVDKKYKKFFDQAKNAIGSFHYASDRMKQEFTKYLPGVRDNFETSDGNYVLVVSKTKDLLILSDVLQYFGGKLPDRHVAWIISSLCNIACYLGYSEFVHHALTLDNLFISPEFHSVSVLGGWWYCVRHSKPITTVPTAIAGILPARVKRDKIACFQTDQESIKAIGRELLGDRAGIKLVSEKPAPEPMLNWLRESGSLEPVEFYASWKKTLTDAFGAPKFVKMELTPEQLYKL